MTAYDLRTLVDSHGMPATVAVKPDSVGMLGEVRS